MVFEKKRCLFPARFCGLAKLKHVLGYDTKENCQLIIYLLENWNFLRAPGCPYFFLSTALESRVRNPAFLRGARRLELVKIRAREIPRRRAPDWPESPPPLTVALISIDLRVSVSIKGCLIMHSKLSRQKYSLRDLLLTVIFHLPA